MNPQQYALIFANGDTNDGSMVQQALREAVSPLIIAADGGARIAQHYGFTPHLIIGDLDSLTDDEIRIFEAQGSTIRRFPAEKNETDLELTLNYCVAHQIGWIRIIGGLGDRFDQTLANVYLLAMPKLAQVDVALVSGKEHIRLLHAGTHTLSGEVDDTLSLIPLGGDVHGVRTEGLYYPLRNETLTFGLARGISNVFSHPVAQVSHDAGLLLAVHTCGRA